MDPTGSDDEKESIEVFDDESTEAELAQEGDKAKPATISSVTSSSASAAASPEEEQQKNQPSSSGEILFEDIIVKVVGSVVRLDVKSKAYTSYIILVTCHGIERWRVEKRYSAFFQLDEKLRKEHPGLVAKIGKLPEKTVFKRLSPVVIDERKAGLELYLQNVITHLPNWPKLAEFLSTDMKNPKERTSNDLSPKGQKEGFLSKKGKKLGAWKPRYFVFRGGVLTYYQTGKDKDGEPGGIISLENATIYKLNDDGEEKHGFVLISGNDKHVLCAENDLDREEWFKILSMHIEMMTPVDFFTPKPHPEPSKQGDKTAESNDDSKSSQKLDSKEAKKDQKTEAKPKADADKGFGGLFKKGPKTHTEPVKAKVEGLTIEQKKNLVFGVPLQEVVANTKAPGPLDIPLIVYRCVEYIEHAGLKEEGIYRISGNQTDQKELRERFDAGYDIDLISMNYDPHCVAGLLKSFLREIPDPILTTKMRLDFFSSSNIEEKDNRLAEISRLIAVLPQVNFDLLKEIMRHLNKVKSFEDVNKMNTRNIGIVFSPTLQIPAAVFTILMSDYTQVFECADNLRKSHSQPVRRTTSSENDLISLKREDSKGLNVRINTGDQFSTEADD